MKDAKILVTGSTGQIGSELVVALRNQYGKENVVALGHKAEPTTAFKESGPFEKADARNKDDIRRIIEEYKISYIYHLASILSAKGEQNPDMAWDVNMNSLKNVLDLAVEYKMDKVFWPSSIAVFGPAVPKKNTPQQTVLEPTTMYGVTKVAGENLCNYYFKKYDLDVRSLRYPGLISHKTLPGGGTTDYAVEIFYEALKHKSYTCFVREDTMLPMMYMDDAIKAAVMLMEADPAKISVRTSYNIAAMSFSVKELVTEIKKHIPNFVCKYSPDSRQKIADSWPDSIDDSVARKDWGWKPEYRLKEMASVMIRELRDKI